MKKEELHTQRRVASATGNDRSRDYGTRNQENGVVTPKMDLVIAPVPIQHHITQKVDLVIAPLETPLSTKKNLRIAPARDLTARQWGGARKRKTLWPGGGFSYCAAMAEAAAGTVAWTWLCWECFVSLQKRLTKTKKGVNQQL